MSLLMKTRPTLSSIDLWSGFGVITITTTAAALALPFIEVGGLPDGAVITRAVAMLKWRAIMETTDNPVSLQGNQEIQVEMSVGGTWTDAIYLLNQQLAVVALCKEFGDVLIGSQDIKDQVPGNGEFIDFQWLNARVYDGEIELQDLQTGVRIWFTA